MSKAFSPGPVAKYTFLVKHVINFDPAHAKLSAWLVISVNYDSFRITNYFNIRRKSKYEGRKVLKDAHVSHNLSTWSSRSANAWKLDFYYFVLTERWSSWSHSEAFSFPPGFESLYKALITALTWSTDGRFIVVTSTATNSRVSCLESPPFSRVRRMALPFSILKTGT